jgi:ABC-type taurine transport system substrate-binding protein
MKFLAFDGKVFETVEECAAHEAAKPEARVVGLTPEQVAAALARTDIDLADAFEAIGSKIARARRESGDLKRTRKGNNPVGDVTAEEFAGVPLAPGAAS